MLVENPGQYLHLITKCCLSPVKINRGSTKDDNTGPEWHYCLVEQKWMAPYITEFIRYEEVLDKHGDNRIMPPDERYFFHNLGQVITRGKAAIVCHPNYWKGRTLNFPKRLIQKPDTNEPFRMYKQK